MAVEPRQSLRDPLGVGGKGLHTWALTTRTFQRSFGNDGGATGGGAAAIRQYPRERLIDELHLAVSPVLLGSGEPLFEGLDLPALGYACVEYAATPHATHVVLRRG